MASSLRGKSWQLRWLAFVALLFGTSLLAVDSAVAEPRLALLISNQKYAETVGPLVNPHNDIALIKATLLRIGFAEADIQVVADADRIAMLQAFDSFAARLRRAGPEAVSFFYYSGHGAANERRDNFLIPVDVQELTSTGFWYRSVALRDLLDRLNAEAPEARHFIVFDACRNTLKLREPGSRSLVQPKGFQPVANIPGGMLIAFSTAEGELASDVGERAGPYATMLAEEIVKPGLEAITVFRNVQLRVSATLRQKPWTQNGPIGETYFAGRAQPPLSEAAQAWQAVQSTESDSVMEDFIRRHGDTIYGNLARAKLAELRATVTIRVPLTTCRSPNVWVSLAGRGGKCIRPGSGESFRDCWKNGGSDVCGPEMVIVPAGEFLMGSPASEKDRSENEDDTPGKGGEQVPVRIAKPFAVGKFEVTFDDWDACVAESGCKYKPTEGPGRGNQPVINLSWDDITKEYLPWLSKKTSKIYRLLTEAEWEYAARAGTTTRYWFGDAIDEGKAQYNSYNLFWTKTMPVNSFSPNPWGLYNVHGIVWEWVQDCNANSYMDKPRDGSAVNEPKDCNRVVRGGSWYNNPVDLRAAVRSSHNPDDRDNGIGFRLASTLDP
jgi:formylglycine-generating enzyme required for sulfatase activity